MSEENKKIFCIECQKNVSARLTSGRLVYTHRKDLSTLPFWICVSVAWPQVMTCKNFVGCHHKSENRTRPLGCIPNPHMKRARIEIHKILDPMWKSDKNKRRKIYSALSKFLGRQYHIADLRSIEEARDIYRQILKLKKNNFLEHHYMLNEKYPRLASWGR